jgi:hypothetical protein
MTNQPEWGNELLKHLAEVEARGGCGRQNCTSCGGEWFREGLETMGSIKVLENLVSIHEDEYEGLGSYMHELVEWTMDWVYHNCDVHPIDDKSFCCSASGTSFFFQMLFDHKERMEGYRTRKRMSRRARWEASERMRAEFRPSMRARWHRMHWRTLWRI